MMNNCIMLDDLINPGIEPGDVDGLLKHAQDVYGLILTEDDLEEGIPENYEEEAASTPICDFEDVLTRLQKTITQQHTSRILAGKESLKSINQKLKAGLTENDIVVTDSDLNEILDHSSYSAAYIINVKEVCQKFRDEQAAKNPQNAVSHQNRDQQIVPNVENEFEEVSYEIEIDDDEDRTPKRRKQNESYSGQGAHLQFKASSPPGSRPRIQIRPPSKSPEVRRVMDVESTPIISNVKSLAPNPLAKPLQLPKTPAVSFNNPAAATYGKRGEDMNSRERLITTVCKKASPDGSGKSIYQILNSSSTSSQQQPKSNVDGEASSNKSRINPEMVQIQATTNTNGFVLKGSHPASANPEQQKSVSYAAQKASAAADVKLRMSLAQAHIAERAQNPTRKTVGGVEYLGCRTCGKTFPAGCDVMYRNHMMVKHSIEVDDANIESSKIKTDAWYKCRKCYGMILNNKEEHHMACLPHVPFDEAFDKIEVAPNTVKPMGCGICNKSYESRISLRQHLTGFHREFGSRVLVDPQFRCGRCLRMFEDSVPLTIHCFNCKTSKPGDDTVLELARGTLYCEICNKKHKNVEETQQCYSNKGLIRCLLCLHTVISRGNFFHHMKVYHNRLQNGIACQFCDNGIVLHLRSLFEHIVEAHYNPALENAANGIIPQTPNPGPMKVPQNQEKLYRRVIQQMPVFIAPKPMLPPGIVINTNRVSTSSGSAHGGLINTSRIQIVPPSRNIVVSAGTGAAGTFTSTASPQQQQQIRFVTTANGGIQGFQLIPSAGGRFALPPGMRLVNPTMIRPVGGIAGARGPGSVNILKAVSFPSAATQPLGTARAMVVPSVTRPIMITSVRGGAPTTASAAFATAISKPRAMGFHQVGSPVKKLTPVSSPPKLISIAPKLPKTPILTGPGGVAKKSGAGVAAVSIPSKNPIVTSVGANTNAGDENNKAAAEKEGIDSILGF